jgi:5-deoxy-glucuronate isomerase
MRFTSTKLTGLKVLPSNACTLPTDVDELMMVSDSELVISPEGYHPVVAAPGYNVYYLNFLAGTINIGQCDDPDFRWVKETWKFKDPRVPMVTLDMNQKPQ